MVAGEASARVEVRAAAQQALPWRVAGRRVAEPDRDVVQRRGRVQPGAQRGRVVGGEVFPQPGRRLRRVPGGGRGAERRPDRVQAMLGAAPPQPEVQQRLQAARPGARFAQRLDQPLARAQHTPGQQRADHEGEREQQRRRRRAEGALGGHRGQRHRSAGGGQDRRAAPLRSARSRPDATDAAHADDCTERHRGPQAVPAQVPARSGVKFGAELPKSEQTLARPASPWPCAATPDGASPPCLTLPTMLLRLSRTSFWLAAAVAALALLAPGGHETLLMLITGAASLLALGLWRSALRTELRRPAAALLSTPAPVLDRSGLRDAAAQIVSMAHDAPSFEPALHAVARV
ncbi:MAG TPA: hypothetical protein VNU48_11885, partial [Burkholderiaceae bacterium]|nr:hypothetical protein [Burkholderiaceae bacterium]